MNSSTRCAACRYLRQRCPSDCIFAPYFPATNPKRFEHAHKIYGASNISKMLKDLPVHWRAEAAETLCYEAFCRQQDPVYGVVAAITALQEQIHNSQCQLAQIQAQIAVATVSAQNCHSYQQQPQQNVPPSSDEGASNANYDISTWFYTSIRNGSAETDF